jgi:hypothetical protein
MSAYARSAPRTAPVRDQRLDLDAAGFHALEELGHVAALGPAHVAERIIDAALFVGRIVAARTVRTRQHERKLLVVIHAVRKVHLRDAHDDDAPAVAAQFPASSTGRSRTTPR